jgi:hypothetical protein
MKHGQYAVILNDVQSDVTLNENGAVADSDATVPIFSTLTAAQSYAHEIVTWLPRAAASIYDHRGKGGGLVETVYHESIRHRFDPIPKARRDCLLGAVFLLAATTVIIYTAMNDWRFIWTYVVGPKLLILGLGFSIRGISVLVDPPQRRSEENA